MNHLLDEINVTFAFAPPQNLSTFVDAQLTGETRPRQDFKLYQAKLDLYRLALLREYDELLCLDTLRGVDHYWYQIETVRKVLKQFRGRVLLAARG